MSDFCLQGRSIEIHARHTLPTTFSLLWQKIFVHSVQKFAQVCTLLQRQVVIRADKEVAMHKKKPPARVRLAQNSWALFA